MPSRICRLRDYVRQKSRRNSHGIERVLSIMSAVKTLLHVREIITELFEQSVRKTSALHKLRYMVALNGIRAIKTDPPSITCGWP